VTKVFLNNLPCDNYCHRQTIVNCDDTRCYCQRLVKSHLCDFPGLLRVEVVLRWIKLLCHRWRSGKLPITVVLVVKNVYTW